MEYDTQKIAGDSDVWAFVPDADTQRLPFGNIHFHTAKLLVADVRYYLSLTFFHELNCLNLSFVPTAHEDTFLFILAPIWFQGCLLYKIAGVDMFVLM